MQAAVEGKSVANTDRTNHKATAPKLLMLLPPSKSALKTPSVYFASSTLQALTNLTFFIGLLQPRTTGNFLLKLS